MPKQSYKIRARGENVSIVERLGWWLVARSSGYQGRCDKGHVLPDNEEYVPCSFCSTWCEECETFVGRDSSLDGAHRLHPKLVPSTLSSKVEKLYADGDINPPDKEAS